VNARLLWDAGLVSYGYGTDTQWPPKETLADELRALRLVFSPQDVVKIITKNAATATMHGAEIGTLEPGKAADVLLIDRENLAAGDSPRFVRDFPAESGRYVVDATGYHSVIVNGETYVAPSVMPWLMVVVIVDIRPPPRLLDAALSLLTTSRFDFRRVASGGDTLACGLDALHRRETRLRLFQFVRSNRVRL
jgi:hypothetical protein